MPFTLSDIDLAVKTQLKETRLKGIMTQWYDFYLTKVVFEANGNTTGADLMTKNMEDAQRGYDALLTVDVELM